MGNRAKGSGSLRERAPGIYRLRVYVGRDPLTGKPRQASRDVEAKNVTQARKMLAEFVEEQKGAVLGSGASVATVMEQYMKRLDALRRSPLTIRAARNTVDNVIVPALGKIPVDQLEPHHVEAMTAQYGHLSAASVKRYQAVLSAGMGLAVKRGWIAVNPCDRAELAKPEERLMDAPTPEEVEVLIGAMPDEVWKVALRLAVATGMRRGELCALRWSDGDGNVIKVRQSAYRVKGETLMKSTKSNRQRPITLTADTRAILSGWKSACDERARSAQVVVGPDAYVLSTWPDNSRPLNPDTLSAHVTRVAKELDMRHIHLHSLRHYAATQMLARGVSVRDVAQALGHSDGGRLALQVYGHPTGEGQMAAAEAMSAALPSPPEKNPNTTTEEE